MTELQSDTGIEWSVGNLVRMATRRMRGAPAVPSQHSAEVEIANLAWVERFRLVEGNAALAKVGRIGCGSFAAHTYPNGSRALVELGANLISWLYLFDDRFGEDATSTEPFASLEHLARTSEITSPITPFHFALADLRRRFELDADASWFARFAESLATYFEGCRLEVPYRKSGRSPSLEEYRIVRQWSVGGLPVFDLIELGLEKPLPLNAICDPDMRHLRNTAALLCAWVNDIFSFDKERRDGDPLNLVAVLRSERNLTVADAFVAASDVYNDDLARFERIADGICRNDRTSKSQRVYIDGLSDWIHGNRAWTGTSLRYGHLAIPDGRPSQVRRLPIPAPAPSHS